MAERTEAVLDHEIPAGAPWAGVVMRGQRLRIIDLEGRQGVDFLCYAGPDYRERYHAPNTLKAARTLRLTTGHILYSDEARPLMRLTADTFGGHDTIAGCCSAVSNRMLYGVEQSPGCRENFLSVLSPYGLGPRDIVPNLNFFCSVPVYADGALAEAVFLPATSRAGDHVELQAAMDVLCVISNCPQVNNPCNAGEPTPIRVQILAAGDDEREDPAAARSARRADAHTSVLPDVQ